MIRGRLHILLKRLSETDTAWTRASTAGATHIQTVSNAIVTFADATVISSASPPAEGQLWNIHEEASASLEWIRTCLRRLQAALRGAKQVQDELSEAVSKGSEVSDPLLLPLSKWAEFVESVVLGLEADLKDKQGVLDGLLAAIRGGIVNRDRLSFYIATWLEQPQRESGEAEFLFAAFQAESLMQEEIAKRNQEALKSPVGTPQKERKGESAALAMLRNAGSAKKRRGKS